MGDLGKYNEKLYLCQLRKPLPKTEEGKNYYQVSINPECLHITGSLLISRKDGKPFISPLYRAKQVPPLLYMFSRLTVTSSESKRIQQHCLSEGLHPKLSC